MKTTPFFLFLNALFINVFGQAVESHFGVHTGKLSFYAVAPYIDSLGAQIYVRRGVPIADDYGWYYVKSSALTATCLSNRDTARCPTSICDCSPGSYYYRNPVSRTPLPVITTGITNPFIDILINRYDTNIPTTLDSIKGDYPHGHETDYMAFVDYLLLGYQDSIIYWEVGNENDAKAFWSGSQQEYADLVALSSGKIRNSCSNCKIGISFAHPNVASKETNAEKHLWYEKIATVCDTFDFIDSHFYSPYYIENGQMDSLKQACPEKEFITTETGIPDTTMNWGPMGIQNAGGTLEKQARDLVKYNTLLFAEGYNKIYWYLMDVDYGMGPIFEHNALVNKDGFLKPAFTSYKTMINMVDSFTKITKLTVGQYKYTFTNKDSVYVLWCEIGFCSMPSEITGTVTVTDYMGNAITKSASQIILDSIPIYVELGIGGNSINESAISQNNISIYPNPAYTTITVSIPSNGKTENVFKNAILIVYNSYGQQIKQIKNISGQKISLSRDNLPSGLYFIRLTEENKIYTDKLVITDN